MSIFAFVSAASAADHTWFVAGPNGSGTHDGQSWANAFATLDEALIGAASDQGTSEIRVKAHGTSGSAYLPSIKLDPSSSDDSLKSFFVEAEQQDVDKYLDVRGGFPSGTSSPGVSERDGSRYPTQLSGQLTTAIRVYHVVTVGAANEHTRIDGLDISGGQGGDGGTDWPSYIEDANNVGGGVFCLRPPSGGSDETVEWRPLVANCDIHDNSSKRGGGIGARGFIFLGSPRREVAPIVQLSRIRSNDGEHGGGVSLDIANADLSNSLVYGNHASIEGAGLYAAGASSLTIRGCTITQNAVAPGGGDGGGLSVGGAGPAGSKAYIWNTIVYANEANDDTYRAQIKGGAGGDPIDTQGITIGDSCVQGFPVPNPETGQNVISDDPNFVDPYPLDPLDADFRLMNTSACIDVGSLSAPPLGSGVDTKMPSDVWDADDDGNVDELLPTVDRKLRVLGCEIDMGAYEFIPCPGDLNNDGTVGSADLSLLLGAWGPTWGHEQDLNEDGEVGSIDLGALLGAWGSCSFECPEMAVNSGGGESLDPFAAAAAYGFVDVGAFGLWLGQFGPEFAADVLWSFTTGGGDS